MLTVLGTIGLLLGMISFFVPTLEYNLLCRTPFALRWLIRLIAGLGMSFALWFFLDMFFYSILGLSFFDNLETGIPASLGLAILTYYLIAWLYLHTRISVN